MRNIRLTLEYQGTQYHGWQRQKNSPSIQEHLEEAIKKVTGKKSTAFGAGRTDAGVHARGQVANFKTTSTLSLEALLHAINAHLPADIAAKKAEEAPLDFDARKSARGKVYSYHIYDGPTRPALFQDFAYYSKHKLSERKMRQAGRFLLGQHDFRAFRTSGSSSRTSVRQIRQINIKRRGESIIITIEGSGFLYNMVRAMVGTLMEVGRGKIAPVKVKEILESKNRSLAGPTAPPPGLFLDKVLY
jgi:tRNA pseudouridine38-40 synthase